MKKYLIMTFILTSINASAITCAEKVVIYGISCTQEEILIDLQNQQLDLQRKQLKEMQRHNKLLENRIDLLNAPRQMYDQNSIENLLQQRCLVMPLGTPGC